MSIDWKRRLERFRDTLIMLKETICASSVRGPCWRGRNGAAISNGLDDGLDAVGCGPLWLGILRADA